MRAILLLLSFVTLVGCSKSGRGNGHGAESVRPSQNEPIPSTNANAALETYISNVAIADSQYLNKVYDVVGYMAVPKKEADKYVVYLQQEPVEMGGRSTIREARRFGENGVCVGVFVVEFGPELLPELAKLKPQDRITVRGVITGQELRTGDSGLMYDGARASKTVIVRQKAQSLVEVVPKSEWAPKAPKTPAPH